MGPDGPVLRLCSCTCVLNNAWKNMSPQFWQELADALRGSASVCVIGTWALHPDSDLLKIEYDIQRFKTPEFASADLSKYLTGVDYFWDEPLTRVAQLLANVREWFISVHSGPSHLMRMIRRPHIELYPNKIMARHAFPKDVEAAKGAPTVASTLGLLKELRATQAL